MQSNVPAAGADCLSPEFRQRRPYGDKKKRPLRVRFSGDNEGEGESRSFVRSLSLILRAFVRTS